MPPSIADAENEVDRRVVRWLRILKLLLSVALMAIALWRAITAGGPV